MDIEFELDKKLNPFNDDEECVKCVEAVRKYYDTEKRIVRNWNEGLEGEVPTMLLRALKGFEQSKNLVFFQAGLGELCLARLRKCPCAAERRLLAYGLWAWYMYTEDRSKIRLALGDELRTFGSSPQWRWIISPILATLKCILQGICCSEETNNLQVLWSQCLRPLYLPAEFAEWRDQLPLLGTYHAELTACTLAVCVACTTLGAAAITAVLDAWPTSSTASTSKEVLLITTLEQLLCAKNEHSWIICDAQLEYVLPQCLNRLALCASSENWRLCERGLHVWRRPEIAIRFNRKQTISAFAPALLRDGTPHWNPTVNRMTLLVLDHLAAIDSKYLNEIAEHHFSVKQSTQSTNLDLRGWRPDSGQAPPLTLTGAAPWAIPQTNNDQVVVTLASFRSACAAIAQEHTYAEHAEYTKAWAAALVAAAPERLPNLKFHDLVFGRELGQGAFGVVKYAKRIVREISREAWPELAVKVVTRAKLNEHKYESSVAREICALRKLEHPGIARLISSFKWREDIYLVLEYAANFDLHCDIRDRGALDLESTRFVVGSVLAALLSIHEIQLVFGDLKPENVLITAAGHLKLTDFGGCRGATSASARDLEFEAATALRDLRDGDWRPSNTSSSSEQKKTTEIIATPFSQEKVDDDDDESLLRRVEGTLLYAPPEVCAGQLPTPAADVWALACVAHFCAEAKPRIQAETDEEARRLVAALDPTTLTFANTTPNQVQAFETACLTPEPRTRPSLQSLETMPLLATLNLRTIYESPAPPLARADARISTLGAIRAPDDAKWAQRQYSMIWAPLDSGDTSPKSQNTVSPDVLGPWLDLASIPAKPADLSLPFVLTTHSDPPRSVPVSNRPPRGPVSIPEEFGDF